jgi:peptidoglycan/LPS O-acetylase OafA/YrhL
MVEATPEGRDRYVDLLRAFSILVVVVGHWLMAVIYLDSDGIRGSNALDVVPGLWLLTWVLQVMPLFFVVGGFSNLVAWRSLRRKHLSYASFLRSRVVRLMRPTLVFVAAWTGAAILIHLAFPGSSDGLGVATELVAKPLWFLAVYVLVVALAPLMIALHDRHGLAVPLAMVLGAAFVDVLRIGFGIPAIGYLNFAFVWLFAHQLGFFYADGVLTSLSRRFLVGLAAASLGILTVLTAAGIYSPSMVGMKTSAASNNSPPTVCLILLTIWLTSGAMLLRPAATRWLQHRKVWASVIVANSMIMTIFLWHLTAALVAVLVLFPVGFPQPRGGSALWWAWRRCGWSFFR